MSSPAPSAARFEAPRWRSWAAAAALVGAVAVAHGGAVRNGFVTFDDEIYAYENPYVHGGITADGIAWAFGSAGRTTYFHPLTWLSLMLDAELFGVHAWAFHLVNVLLHALCAVLLFVLLRTATGREGAAFGAALLWAVHPVTVEAVAWIAERKAVLSTALALGAMLCHASHVRRPAGGKLAATTALAVAAVLAKPATVVLPALLLALDFWPLRRFDARPVDRGQLRRALFEKLPAALLALAVVAVGIASLRRVYGPSPSDVALGTRVVVAVAALPRYLEAAVNPSALAVLHPYPASLPWARFALGSAVLVLGTGAALALARRWPAGLATWAFFLLAIGPYLGLYQAGLWPEWAERFAYLPLVGVAIAVAFAGADLARRWAPRWAPIALGVAALAATAATRAQVEVWRDSVSLYAHATKVEPSSAVLHSNLGNALVEAGRVAEARAAFERALTLDPWFPPANGELGRLLMLEGDGPGAERHFLRALRIHPDSPQDLYNYAELLRTLLDDPVRARRYYARFAEVAPPKLDRERRAALDHLGR